MGGKDLKRERGEQKMGGKGRRSEKALKASQQGKGGERS